MGKITRNLSLDKYKEHSAKKRGNGQIELALSELDEAIASTASVEREAEENELAEILDRFLERLPKQKRVVFVQRYWYLLSINEIAENCHAGESKIKSTLFRTRNELKNFLEKEGIML
ncbi:MAG: RNA polymerase sigma factor [Oscillospiraceae bacterium]|nr:RNA polymerase sigma factor [Oscillospiraceae bacterium]